MLLKNAKILNDAFAWQTGDLKIENGRIAALGDRLPDEPDSLDCTGCTVTPGLIDIHTHGADGVDYSLAPSPAELARALRLEARQGVTAVLPSMMTTPCAPTGRRPTPTRHGCRARTSKARSSTRSNAARSRRSGSPPRTCPCSTACRRTAWCG